MIDDSGQHYNPQKLQGTSSTPLPTVTNSANTSNVQFAAPAAPGNYQLHVTITSSPGPAATAAILFVISP